MRLPARRESNAGSQPLQPAAKLRFALTVVNFSSRIEREKERKRERERENHHLFRIKINYTTARNNMKTVLMARSKGAWLLEKFRREEMFYLKIIDVTFSPVFIWSLRAMENILATFDLNRNCV